MINLWRADVIGLDSTRHYVIAASGGYQAKCEARREATCDGLTGPREVFLTHLVSYEDTASVGRVVAIRDAEATGLITSAHLPRLNPANLVTLLLQEGLREANGNDPSTLVC